MSSFKILSVPSFFKTINKRIQPILGDGNCFYRALAVAEYQDEEFHKTIRNFTMSHIQHNPQEYIPYFDDSDTFYRCLHANKKDGVWNTEMGDIAPSIVPDLLDIHLIIYDYIEGSNTIGVYKFGNPAHKDVELFRTNNSHYDLVLTK